MAETKKEETKKKKEAKKKKPVKREKKVETRGDPVVNIH